MFLNPLYAAACSAVPWNPDTGAFGFAPLDNNSNTVLSKPASDAT
jgi:hypothetical protein